MFNRMVDVGYGNLVKIDEIEEVCNYASAPIKKRVKDAKENDLLINCTTGKEIKSVVVLKSGKLIKSHLKHNTIKQKIEKEVSKPVTLNINFDMEKLAEIIKAMKL